MQKKKRFLPVFLFLLSFSILLFLLSRAGYLNGIVGFFEKGSVSLQRTVFGVTRLGVDESSEITRLRDENIRLTQELAKRTNQDQEVRALRDQFDTSSIKQSDLLPARVIGAMSNRLIVDKGVSDGIQHGDIVVYKDNLIGRISKASGHLSVVDLVTSKDISLTAKSINSQSIGVVKGDDGGIVLDHVVLSEKISKGDVILTKGDVDEQGRGFPPDLIVGKIETINKKASNLFQTAEVRSLVDFSKLETVFLMTTDN
jgi:rod shape-determining protein MreC